MANPLRRFLEWRRRLLTPEDVEKAGLLERIKRGVWMVVSAVIAWFTTIAVLGAGVILTRPPDWVVLVVALPLWLYIDFRVHRWGVQYFGITPPWQFRDTEVES